MHFTTPNNKSSNSDIERFHNTLNEHLRIFAVTEKEQGIPSDENPVIKALKTYNETIHSSTLKKPIDFLNGNIKPSEYPLIKQNLLKIKNRTINSKNKNRTEGKYCNYLKLNRVNKLQPYHKRIDIVETKEDHVKINKEIYPRYINQFKRKLKYQN